MGIKKSLLVMILLSLSIFEVQAVRYTNDIIRDGGKDIQKQIGELTDEQLEYIAEFYERRDANGRVLDKDRVKYYLQDDKWGHITECAAIVTGVIPEDAGQGCVQNCAVNVRKAGSHCKKFNGKEGALDPKKTGKKDSGAGGGSGDGDGGDGDGGDGTGGSSGTVGKSICTYDGEGNPGKALRKCITGKESGEGGDTQLVAKDSLTIEDGLKVAIIDIIQKIASFLALGAIFSIAYGSLLMTLSAGEDDKIKKAKDIIKWGALGFLAVISAGFFIALVVNLMYTLGG